MLKVEVRLVPTSCIATITATAISAGLTVAPLSTGLDDRCRDTVHKLFDGKGEGAMAEAKTIDPRLVAEIVCGYVSHNSTAASDLSNLIALVHRSLAELAERREIPVIPKPAVAINRSYGRDFVICLECRWRGKMMRRHLGAAHGLSPREYRAQWNLRETHPLIAPAY